SQLAPLLILAIAANRLSQRLQLPERGKLSFELVDCLGSSGLVEHFLLDDLAFGVGRVIEVIDILAVDLRHAFRECLADKGSSMEQLDLPETSFEPLAATAQRLIDGLRRRGEASLQDGEGKADGPGAL